MKTPAERFDDWMERMKKKHAGAFSCKEQLDMTLEEAEELAKRTDYALNLCDCDGLNPVNWADAGAFFLEGYLHAKKLDDKGE